MDKVHGFGEYRWQDGKNYVGGWYEGKMNGQGELRIPQGNKGILIKVGVWSIGKLVSLESETKHMA
jgi:hypothetical protein